MANGSEPTISSLIAHLPGDVTPPEDMDTGGTAPSDSDQPTISGLVAGLPGVANAPAPPLQDWPGVVGRTFERAIAPLGYGDVMQGLGPDAPLFPAYMAAQPNEPHYQGPLGFLQAGTEAASSPLIALGPAAAVGTIGGALAGEGARQLGFGVPVQLGASMVGGVTGGGAVEAVESRAAAAAQAEATRLAAVANDPATVAANLRTSSGVIHPGSNLASDMKGAVGDVLQTDVGDLLSGTTRVGGAVGRAAGQSEMQAMPVRLGTHSPEVGYLHSIVASDDPEHAVDIALKSPEHFSALPQRSKDALASWFAQNVETDPKLWINLKASQRTTLVPNATQRNIISNAAEAAVRGAKTPTTPATPTTPTWQSYIPAFSRLIHNPWTAPIAAPIVYGGMRALGIEAPNPELTGLGIAALGPMSRAIRPIARALRQRGIGGNLLSAGVGAYGYSPGEDGQNQLNFTIPY